MKASEIPVLPLVGSSSSRPGSSSPEASAASIIALATRSLIDPVGFWPSSFAKIRTPPTGASSSRGVLPTSSRRFLAFITFIERSEDLTPIRGKCVALSAAATRHGRQKDDGRAGAYFGVEPVQRANV